MRQRDTGTAYAVVETLRLCVVVFLTGVGYQVARGIGGGESLVGPFDAPGVGMILGASTGYVLGGVVARLALRTVEATESSLSGRSAEQLLAALVGAVAGVLASAALAWPMLLVGSVQFTAPLFVFVLVTIGTLGYRVGFSRREGVLALLGDGGRLERRRPTAASLPRLVDTSVAIDGRVLDVVRAGFLHGVLLVPEPVLGELQGLADSADEKRRARGRRGLDTLETLRRERGVDLEVIQDEAPESPEVDGKLVHIALKRGAALLTLDTNLARVAAVAGAHVMNLHALAFALRPPLAAGESVTVLLTRPGKEAGQAVGYLDDGTMVVVERARERIGQEVSVSVTSVLVTANGRLVFARAHGEPPTEPAATPHVPVPRPSDVAARMGSGRE